MTTPLLDSNGKLNGESVRYVAIGDSFTEGVGDVDPRRPNGVRGWADRVAAAIGSVDPEATYANLAIRGRLLNPIIDEQLPVALDLCRISSPSTAAVTISCVPTSTLISS